MLLLLFVVVAGTTGGTVTSSRKGYEVHVGGESDKSYATRTEGMNKQEALVLLGPYFAPGTLTEENLKSVQAVESARGPLPAGSSLFAPSATVGLFLCL